jgi:signal transduction histidine kinase
VARSEYKMVADVEMELGELPQVTCHGSQINQVLLNLIINSAHAIADKVGSSGDRGRITVRSRAEAEHVAIEIEDTGGGIPENIRARARDWRWRATWSSRATAAAWISPPIRARARHSPFACRSPSRWARDN